MFPVFDLVEILQEAVAFASCALVIHRLLSLGWFGVFMHYVTNLSVYFLFKGVHYHRRLLFQKIISLLNFISEIRDAFRLIVSTCLVEVKFSLVVIFTRLMDRHRDFLIDRKFDHVSHLLVVDLFYKLRLLFGLLSSFSGPPNILLRNKSCMSFITYLQIGI